MDAEQRLIQQEYRSTSDELIYYRFYSYDHIGNLEKIEVCNPDGSVAIEINYSYDEFNERDQWLLRSEYYSYSDVRRPHEQVLRIMP